MFFRKNTKQSKMGGTPLLPKYNMQDHYTFSAFYRGVRRRDWLQKNQTPIFGGALWFTQVVFTVTFFAQKQIPPTSTCLNFFQMERSI